MPAIPIDKNKDSKITIGSYSMFYQCPNCAEYKVDVEYNFCPHCGVEIEWI